MRECEQQNLWAITNEQDHPWGGLVFWNVPRAEALTVVSAVSRPLPRQGQAVQAIRGGTAKRLLGL